MTTRDWLLADSPSSRWQANAGRAYHVFTALLRNPLSVLGGAIILVLLLTAILAPWIAPYSATGQDLAKIAKDTDRDFYLNAEAAKEYGVVDNILQKLPSQDGDEKS